MAHMARDREGRGLRIALIVNFILGGIFLAAAVFTVLLVYNHERQKALDVAKEKARIILDRNLATHAYFTRQLKPSVFELTEGVRTENFFDPRWMSSTFAIKGIDKMFKELKPWSKYYYKEAAIGARTAENEADGIERGFIFELNENPKLMESSEVRVIGGEPFYVVMQRGEIMEKSCLMCHSVPQNAPADMVDYYGPERGFNREVGRTVSALSIRVPLSEAYAEVNSLTYGLLKMLLPVLLFVFAVQYLITNALMKSNRNLEKEVARRRQAEDGLKILASTDEMTGMANRRNGLLFLEKQLQLSRREGSALSVCYVDINGLKEVNDAYGHKEGDELIRIAGGLMKEPLRESDMLCRLGGDEFLLVFPRCSLKRAVEVWERVEQNLKAFNEDGKKPYIVGLSHGFAEFGPTGENSVDELISIADREMYRKKQRSPKQREPMHRKA